MSRRQPTRNRSATIGWSRGRLLLVLAGAALPALVLLTGLGLAVYFTVHANATRSPHGPTRRRARLSTSTASSDLASAQDALANRPLPSFGLQAAQPGPVSVRDPGTIVMPRATRTGPAGVPTGFPHTPTGALAQLAALDQTAMQSGTLAGVRAVIAHWAAPGGPTVTSWSAVRAMASLLDGAGLSGGGSPQLALAVTPLMGMIKGSVGTNFVVACVDFEFDATLSTTERVAAADCQRMTWRQDRWIIGAGAEPADPPSVWPDTDLAVRVGYKDLRHA